ncbi:uncharacterized protein BCR38DRAFT_74408 [Pseudomassariella vexata]|uniref:Succinate dehydrogenase assembly factor 4, mitochondrial n=1 Tax=Pseudomassariella vexata TaxID=1141098 RepID=A0A1Y2DH20_9PEZI|nr:uncharacterized protein BCR38DRAFT_74408 [Pseudomassariella vexata]ORY58550.1 hypothetical protein BCR38DRAFT_74408 [Pseudomassariella vexata]
MSSRLGLRHLARRSFLSRTSARLSSTTPFSSFPAPPRLPADQQAEFERLQRSANTQEPITASMSDSPDVNFVEALGDVASRDASGNTQAATLGDVTNLPLRKGAPPEFEGDTNPKTGEVGGPKNEPLRWGSGGDWSYNGRVTDF